MNNKNKSFDLANFNMAIMAEKGAECEIMHPVDDVPLTHDDGSKVIITVVGTDSKAYRNKNKELQRNRIDKMVKGRRKTIDHTVSDEDACEMLAVCTNGWSGMVLEGKEIKFSKKAAAKLYFEQTWIREQVDAFIGDRANFFTSAS